MTEPVTYVSQWYHPENLGVVCWIPEYLHEHDWNVTVLTGIPNYPTGIVFDGYRADQASREIIDGIEVRRTPLYPSHDARATGRILNLVSWALSSCVYGMRDLRTAGLALVFSSPVTANLAPMLARLLFGVRYVTMVEDLWPDSVFDAGFLTSGPVHRIAKATLGSFAKLSYRLASHVTVISPGMKQVLIERGVPAEKISLVYNWVDEELFVPGVAPDPRLRERLGLTNTDFVCLYAGAHGAPQNLSVLIDAMALIDPDEHIHLVTLGDGIERQQLTEQVALQGLTDRVHLLGPVPMDEMPGLLAAADLHLVSLRDTPLFAVTMPSKVQSLLASGMPLLVVARGDAADVVTQAGAGLAAPPTDPAAIAAQIRTAQAVGADMLRDMGKRGRELYEQQMSARIGGSRLSEILQAVRRARP